MTEPRTSIRILPSLALAVALTACGAPPEGYSLPSDGTGEPVGQFSDLELAIVRAQLGSLPDRPPPSPTNRFADDPRAAALGQKFFFEKGYSANGEVSCATCHIPSAGFQDNRANTSAGIDFTGRSSPTIINAVFGSGAAGSTVWQFWDGRKDSFWSQALGPPENEVEMGGTRTAVTALVAEKYASEYQAIFGALPALDAPDAVTEVYVNFGKAIEAYERLVVSRNSAFDRFRDAIVRGAADSDELDASQKLGLKIFVGKGGCISCHRGPNFSDWTFHNIGVSQADVEHVPAEDSGRAGAIERLASDEFNCTSRWSDASDAAGCAVTGISARDTDTGAFKTPTLRNVALTAPYFHTGGLDTLDAVVDFYDQGGEESGYVGSQDRNIRKLSLTREEKQALVDFLGALTGDAVDPALTSVAGTP
jgi:cytochrome c peroxidase